MIGWRTDSRAPRIAGVVLAALVAASAHAGEYEVDLAMQLANPVTAPISVPLQLDHDSGIGPTVVFLKQSTGKPSRRDSTA